MRAEPIPAGTSVRVRSNPSKIGVATSNTQTLGPLLKQQFIFGDGRQFLAINSVEVIEEGESADPLDLIRKQQFAGARVLNQSFVFHRLNGSLADILYSMDATNTDYYAYQYKPLLNFLDSPSQGLLIADEVGLGKTIEAGIIWTELRARYDYSCLLVVCPATLCEKWRLELLHRFSIKAEICSATDLLRRLQEHVRGDLEDFALICSIQGIRPPRRAGDVDVAGKATAKLAEFFEEHRHQRYLFDLVIVDEAHYMRNSESLARRLGTDLRDLSHNLLLLSATPVQMRNEDLFSQLSLLDPDTFVSLESFEEVLEANEPLIRLRDSVLRHTYSREEYIADLEETRRYPIIRESRQIQSLRDSIPSAEQFTSTLERSRIADQVERVNLLSHVVSRTRKRDVNEFRVIRRAHAEFIPMNPLEASIYEQVTEEIIRFCISRPDLPEGFALATPQRQISSSVPAAVINWRQRGAAFEVLEEDAGYLEEETVLDEARFGPLVGKMIEIAAGIGDVDSLERNDTKFERLSRVLAEIYADNGLEKLLVFSYFKPTLNYLHRRLENLGYRCELLHGDIKEPKDQVIERFRQSDRLQILLSSEVASEGIDLQFCRILINYDLPWNPMQIEQRIGRIDRIGQTAETISIWNLFYEDTIDARIYDRLLTRLGIFERALGGVETIVGDRIMNLTNQLLRQELTLEEQEHRIAQTEQAIANIQAQNERLENEASAMVAFADTILQQVSAVRDLQRYVKPRDLWDFVGGVLETQFPDSRLILKDEQSLVCDIQLCSEAQFQFERFLRERKSRIRTALLHDRRRTHQFRFVTRAENFGAATEAITNFHPFVRFLGEKLTADGIPMYPPVAVQLDAEVHRNLRPGIFPFYVKKLTFKGAQTLEWLKFGCAELGTENVVLGDEAERLVSLAANHGRDWLVGEHDIRMNVMERCLAHCEIALDADMEFQAKRLAAENYDRVDLQARNVARKFEREIRRNEEIVRRMAGEGKTQGARLRESQIRSLSTKKEKRLFELERSRETSYDATRIVAVGLIRVT